MPRISSASSSPLNIPSSPTEEPTSSTVSENKNSPAFETQPRAKPRPITPPNALKTSLQQTLLNTSAETSTAKKFGLSQASESTRELDETSVEDSLPLKKGESKTLLGFENQTQKKMSTFLVSGQPDMADLAKGNVYFLNEYGRDIWSMQNNMRDPKLADFKMADIVKLQAEKAGLTSGPKVLVRAAIHSLKGEDFFQKNPMAHGSTMNAAQFKEFMETTPNGWSSKSILAKFDMVADKAVVLAEKNKHKQEPTDPNHIYSVAVFTKQS